MSWSLLERFLDSDLFNNDPSLSVAYLSRYANHVGIQYVLCSKLRRFPYEELEFFLPQLCHLLVSVDNGSMALEEFIIDLCQESVSGALLTFWLFQTYLHDLSGNPQSPSFRTCRRIFNKAQNIVFGGQEALKPEKIHENVLPTTVLASIILASIAVPSFSQQLGPLAIVQARKPRPADDTISDAQQVQQRPARSHTVSGASRSRKIKQSHARSDSEAPNKKAVAAKLIGEGRSKGVVTPVINAPTLNGSESNLRVNLRPRRISGGNGTLANINVANHRLSASSLPDFSHTPTERIYEPPASAGYLPRPITHHSLRRRLHITESSTSSGLTRMEKVHLLRSNYFRNETQFLSALEGISVRLVNVPKAARLSALRAELALVAQDLPSEVDIPLICPATLEDGSPSRSKHHRVVRINPAEATSLNSAERVPYLLMVEVLREDFDFNPDSEANQRLLSNLAIQKDSSTRRPFDISTATRIPVDVETSPIADSVFEPANGDLSSVDLLKDFSNDEALRRNSEILDGTRSSNQRGPTATIARSSSGTNTFSSQSMISTPRTSDVPNSRSSSPSSKKMPMASNNRPQGPEQQDFSALATHMRTAAQMLAQLDVSGSKRPRQEVEAIKTKIIASMQSLEEQNFYNDDSGPSATFDSIIAKVNSHIPGVRSTDIEEELERQSIGQDINSSAGAARMENDQKTGGVERGDRDDPSAATFGEEWKRKKERIRRTSPYGWMKSWDLLSVIVKTGSDLRQELFACQLIRICSKIWEEAGVPVWIKQMKILVTGESSGLIETITNGVSLHSVKRSLTLSSIAAGTNPRKRIASLKDHFIRAFGDVDTPAYAAAVDAFSRSLAAYSILSYVIQLKDRHNGNILIDNAGHLIHIDFGFMFSNSPGSVGFEAAAFKLTQEYVDVLGGIGSPGFENFKTLCKQAFQALRKSAENIVSVVETMSKESKMACFQSGATYAVGSLRARFMLHLSQEEALSFVETDLIAKSLGSYYTRLYDLYQFRTQGIY